MKNVELLAPAGDMGALASAVQNGAGAVYFGLDLFNARIRAKNFTLENVGEAIELCHAHGVKAYVTLNTQIYNKELPSLMDMVGKLYEKGVDALIVADFGVACLIKAHYPDFEIHASTQSSAHNVDGVNLLHNSLGYKRVVVARELDQKNIEHIVKNAQCEIEMFVHGAHCMSVSGQCLASYCMGGRSGNRGECAQPCRLPYTIGENKGYHLSLKDMSLSSHIPDIIKSGVASLKIEGRMKGQDYVGGTVKIWDRLLREGRNARENEQRELYALFSRGGFTDGYFMGKIDKSMLGIRSESDKELTGSYKIDPLTVDKARISIEAEFYMDKPCKLTLIHKDKSVTVFGDVVEKAINTPISKADIEKNLTKFGQTPFQVENTTILMDEGIMIRNSSINALRREAVRSFFDSGRVAKEVNISLPRVSASDKKRTAHFENEEQIPDNYDYFDIRFVNLENYKGDMRVNGIVLPTVVFDSWWDRVEKMLIEAYKRGVRYALVSNIGQITRVRAMGFEIYGDFRFNAFNSYTLDYLYGLGFISVVMSPELSLAQLRDFKGQRVIAYGKFPIMTTHKCVLKDTVGCEKCKGYINDRQKESFFVKGSFFHTNIIYNSVPIYMADRQEDIKEYSQHFIFSDENRRECYEVIEAYKNKTPTTRKMRRIK